ncbi:MAG: DUF2834 domain-containing protein [Gammaproteobacteria bacterium]|nr:DUF2834 domain-containing protein [Gammaproteobacteria bacterium]MXY90380.1 DUF2834 domain-containing protein [Gammaproteobacteria bacterium]MYC59105.1 DUF2834 domain-containing protein [Gammaproteobacteria bacterium]MYE30671.1 DUF2834 domain-containing protein [Gammaproteobacteria bacterium]MYG95545.1 DUF2834 domain-containing protein [Gammaproteobacteria bacterium]
MDKEAKMNLRNIWLLLAIAGAVIPWYYLAGFLAANPLDIAGFLAASTVNDVGRGFVADLLISSLVFWVYMFSRRPDGPAPWPFIVINLFIGLSCALPAYLWIASRDSAPANA